MNLFRRYWSLTKWGYFKNYFTIEAICAEWSLLACSLFLAKWLLRMEALDKSLDARFNSDWCIAFLLAFSFENLLFKSAGLELHGLDDKKSSAALSEFFLQRLFLIKGRWFIAFLSRGNPVPCYPNMHFLKEIERVKTVAVDTVFCDQMKYFINFCADKEHCVVNYPWIDKNLISKIFT